MKFVIYKSEKKITVDNALVEDIYTFVKLMGDYGGSELSFADLQLYNVRITSVRGMLLEEGEIGYEEIGGEAYEGINCRLETVN
jgi:hypothetical protein